MKKFFYTLLCLTMSLGLLSDISKANSTNLYSNAGSLDTQDIQPRSNYNWDTNPNSSKYDIFEIHAGDTRKIIGPWYGGFKITNAWGQHPINWIVSASGSHVSNLTKIEARDGKTGEVVEFKFLIGANGSVEFTNIHKSSSAGINFYVTNMTDVDQAFWNINITTGTQIGGL